MKVADLQVVLKIAELQSITEAANQLDMSSSAASIALKRIENALGTQLFVRTTRQIRLSAEGERYLPLCQQALDLLQQGQMAINEEKQAINGEVRMALSSEMGRNLMRNLLNQVMEQHHDLTLRLHVSDSQVDFYRDGVDVALRAMITGAAKETNFYGFKICNIPHLLCASPDYLAKHGTPSSPKDLAEHNALLYKLYKVVHDNWLLIKDDEEYKVKMVSNRAANDGDLVRRWCIDGVGIAKKSAIDVAEDLMAGRLQRFMSDYRIPVTELWLVLPSRQMISPAIRLIRDELKQKINALRLELIKHNLFDEHEWPEHH
ncbi:MULTISPECIES: LysR family transcriptional regulator [unclassified Agarivorans]|uniref:LysR family transcriptional regulator n=1 Tax=unclassified Agarivorans TaxID=2636026 RepID=UPI0026E17686|nr:MULTISPECIES: LysR family transcriptional regulator [unclassified Agarivorans]MDO6684628.1 LysR family transcriptional regulator [Agarivorans sp. 3_MG-2023]MDO6714793.1 LysR family transcriptional regulator [Agarivorans sp. 2_MG-2023]MDO6762816.1 LysR family transcriptional regulator [Agarivorans sp. 1_MG-2023]